MELIRDLPKNFAVAAFADVGNAFDNFGDPLMYSVGVGVRLRLPVVSVGIDVAQALTIPAGSTERPGPAPASQFLAETVMKRRLKIAALIFGLFVLLLLLVPRLGDLHRGRPALRGGAAARERWARSRCKIENVRGTIAGGFGADRVDVDHERTPRARRERLGARQLLAAARGTHLGARRAAPISC